jgi:asparagine synthase (glutamine-hydrolysing)
VVSTPFSVGLEGSPDLAAAQIVADHMEPSTTKLNLQSEGLDAIRDVIYNLETRRNYY